MTDSETLDKARALFVGQTQGDTLAREVIAIAERLENMEAIHKAGCVVLPYEKKEQTYCCSEWIWDEDLGRPISHAKKELTDLRAQRDELWEMLTPLKDAVMFARAQRRPMGIGQDCPRGAPCVCIELGTEYGRERDSVGFWIGSDDVTDAASPSPCERIALALIQLSYAVAEKVKPRP